MAEIALTAAIKKAVEVAAQLATAEWSRLQWLTEDINWLESQMRHIHAYMHDAEDKQVNDYKVKTLLKDVRDLAYDVEVILDAILLENQDRASYGVMKSAICLLPYCLTCRNFSMEIQGIRQRVQAIDDNRKIYGIVDTHMDAIDEFIIDPRIDALHFDEPVVVGQDHDIQRLESKLLDGEEGLPFVAIVGMAGLGKTTLAKRVFNNVRHEFDCSALVSISQKPNVKDVLMKIAKQVGLTQLENLEAKRTGLPQLGNMVTQRENWEAKQMRLTQLGNIEAQQIGLTQWEIFEARQIGLRQLENLEAADLYSFLKTKRYVILLDDIWHTQDWDWLRTCFPTSSNNGCRIIITSRYDSIGRYIGGDKSLHHLHPFGFETSWDLFNKLITPFLDGMREEFEQSELGCIGKKIVGRCGGMALAIVIAVGMLREREVSERAWNEVLKSIGKDSDDKFFQILALSYKDLPSMLKPCFLYLGLFPEDYEIRVSRLVRMWVAEKFIQPCRGLEMEDVGEKYVRKLAVRNLVQVVSRKYDGRIKQIRIHDLLHSLCVNVANEINFCHTILDDNPNLFRVRRLSVQHSPKMTINLVNKNLRIHTLLHFDSGVEVTVKGGEERLTNKSLQVMSIHTRSRVSYPSDLIKNLSHLRYLEYLCNYNLLEFEPCVQFMLSSIPRFQGLETLDLRFCISRVPKCIWKMKQLRHLLLRARTTHYGFPNYKILEILSLPKVSLPNLQTLAQVSVFEVAGLLEPDNFPNLRKFSLIHVTDYEVKKLCGKDPISKKLHTLAIVFSGCINENIDLSRYTNLAKLVFVRGILQLTPEVKFPPNLVKLSLVDNMLMKDPMQVLKSLPKLRIMELIYCYDGKQLDCSGGDSFPQLEDMRITSLHNLEEIICGEERGMHKLTEVTIVDCNNLQQMPEWFQQLCQKKTS